MAAKFSNAEQPKDENVLRSSRYSFRCNVISIETPAITVITFSLLRVAYIPA